jgi:hypothetical protein
MTYVLILVLCALSAVLGRLCLHETKHGGQSVRIPALFCFSP